jgi:hypothetical protein
MVYDIYKANLASFSFNFGGNTAMRSIFDKRGKDAPGPVEAVAGMLWGKKA